MINHNHSAKVYRISRMLSNLSIVWLIINFVMLFWWEYGSGEFILVVFLVSLGIGLVIFAGNVIIGNRYPYNVYGFNWQSGKLYGAHRYFVETGECLSFVASFQEKLISDGYDFLGVIENNTNAIMEVYARNLQTKRETVLFIRTEFFSMDMLLQHRYLFYSFMASYVGKSNLDWIKRMRTVICVREMSIPLRILLSTLKIHTKEIRDVQGAPVYALVEEETKLYTKAYKPEVFLDEETPWIKKYFLSGGYQEPEHVWKGQGWEDLEGLPLGEKEMIKMVHKALNVWKGGYQEEKRDQESGSIEQ